MLAEAIHSVADTGNQALLLLEGRLARRDPDDEFQFGYTRARAAGQTRVNRARGRTGTMAA